MSEHVLLGRDRSIIALPRRKWEEHLDHAPEHSKKRLAFMTGTHHQVRYFVVRELPRFDRPMPPDHIARSLGLSLELVINILDELERHLVFLVRDKDGAVLWAFPVTVDRTPHLITFSSGERLYAAWAEDAVATPFVQGRLRQEKITFDITTSCACCGRILHIKMDRALNYQIAESAADPLIFSPDLDWANFAEPNIIDAYWRNSLFFWSEEHAREYRESQDQVNGIYLNLDQMTYMTPISQGGLFAFTWQGIVARQFKNSAGRIFNITPFLMEIHKPNTF